MNLLEAYTNLLSEQCRWNPTHKEDIEHDFPGLFMFPKSYNFIFELFWADGNLRPLIKDINAHHHKIPENRFSHTVSLYLFGILVAEKIGFNNINLPLWDNDARRNFLHHWSAICLFHDIGYFIENNTDIYPPKEFYSLESIYDKFNISYKMTNKLINDYYKYRIEKFNKIDHGIIAAILLFDQLNKRNSNMQEIAKTALVFSEKPLFGEEYKTSINNYALTIAKHNMWFAKSSNDATYKKYDLFELLPRADSSHKLSLKNDGLLFILCLIDSIEPIKKCGSDSIEKILRSIKLDIQDKSLIISANYIKNENLSKWLDIQEKDNEIKVQLEGIV